MRKQEEEKEKAQAMMFEAKDAEEEAPLETPKFEYDDAIEVTHVDEVFEQEEAPHEETKMVESQKTIKEEKLESEEVKTEKKPLNDLEEAARLAKEKQRAQGINIKEKQEYVSKFEKILDTKTPKNEEQHSYKPKYKRNDDEPKRKATFDLSKKNYELKPIYTEEELEEIARQEALEEENDWINDDIDFDEYDQYYDE